MFVQKRSTFLICALTLFTRDLVLDAFSPRSNVGRANTRLLTPTKKVNDGATTSLAYGGNNYDPGYDRYGIGSVMSGTESSRIRAEYSKWCRRYGKNPQERRFKMFAQNYRNLERMERDSGYPMELNEDMDRSYGYGDYDNGGYGRMSRRGGYGGYGGYDRYDNGYGRMGYGGYDNGYGRYGMGYNRYGYGGGRMNGGGYGRYGYDRYDRYDNGYGRMGYGGYGGYGGYSNGYGRMNGGGYGRYGGYDRYNSGYGRMGYGGYSRYGGYGNGYGRMGRGGYGGYGSRYGRYGMGSNSYGYGSGYGNEFETYDAPTFGDNRFGSFRLSGRDSVRMPVGSYSGSEYSYGGRSRMGGRSLSRAY